MEKNIVSWVAIILMWMFWVIYPMTSDKFGVIERVVSILIVLFLTIYGFFYKEK